MNRKIDIGKNGKVWIVWNVPFEDYSKEQEKSIAALFAKKYGISPKAVKVVPNYLGKDNNSTLASETVNSIHEPKFQVELFKQFIKKNNIEVTEDEFNEIVKIDSQINSLIDFDSYGKSKKYSVKWVKWGNFLSYGPDNYFDFTKLHGLVLLNGEPANKSGKSTFAYDLLHFLLFGKTNTDKAKTLGELFNKYTPDENTLTVEGCINIDGEDYIIKRTLTKPSSGKKTKTVTNKVEYYKLSPDGTEELLPEDNQQGENAKETSAVIKEALGLESDFDLIISANAKDLDSLISLTETEKGRLLSRWIGLSIIEDKDALARNKWNKEISVGRLSDMYNTVQLQSEIDDLDKEKGFCTETIEKNKKTIDNCEKEIEKCNAKRDVLLSSKQQIDSSLLKIDVVTLEASLKALEEKGKSTKAKLEALNDELKNFGNVDYSEEEYKELNKENSNLIGEMAEIRTKIGSLKTTNKNLESAEYCPTCKRKFDNIDNSEAIETNKKEIESLTSQGISKKKRSDEIVDLMSKIEEKRKLAQSKSATELKIATLNSDLANQRADYKEKLSTLKEINKNKEAIAKNAEIDASINMENATIKTQTLLKTSSETQNSNLEKEIAKINETISTKKGYIVKIMEERKVEKCWKIYLQMIGKDGISKMVLRNTLPIINGELSRLLSDVSDFDVEITMNEKNDIDFLLIRDGITTRLSAASGLEKTQAALALRVVLGNMSRLSRPPFILLDEVLGTVAKENYDDMKKLYDKIAEYYDFILHITHISEIADWHDGGIITVVKEDNISRIKAI